MLFCDVEKIFQGICLHIICVLLKMIMFLISIKPIAGIYSHSIGQFKGACGT